MFKLSNVTWTLLQILREGRSALSSMVYNNHWFVIGGYGSSNGIKSIERLSLNTVHINQSKTWQMFAGQLSSPLWAHRTVVYNER